MNCIKIIYKEENGKVTINEVDNYINKQGIWALFGKREDIFEFLNVGKCIDVGREILYDISCLHNILLHKEGNEEYINQFAELCNFKYRKKWTQEYLYQYISSLRYEVITFVYVYNKSDMYKEKELAWTTHARFWKNGSSFKTAQEDFYEKNKNLVLETKTTITSIKNIDELERILKNNSFYSNEEE